MKGILVRIASVGAGIILVAVGVMVTRGGLFYYLSELHDFSPPPYWKSAIIVTLLVAAFAAPCWAAYKFIRFAISPEEESN